MKNAYIDLANLMIETKKKNAEIDYEKLFVFLNNKYRLDKIIIFTGYLSRYASLYQKNQDIGYEYVFKEAVFNKDELKIKANCDVDIAIHGTLHAVENNLKESVLVTSDGDFASLVNFWKKRDIKVRIISPADPNKCSYLLKKDNNSVTYLNQVLDSVRIKNEKALDEDVTS